MPDQIEVTPEKFILGSKTVWGGLIMCIGPTLKLIGVDLDIGQIDALGNALINLFGLGLVFYGRYKAGGVKFKW